jgi:hypothetical protein
MLTKFRSKILKEGDHLGDVEGRIILTLILQKEGMKAEN